MEKEKAKQIEKALNDLIKECADNGGHVWIVDKRGNNFATRLLDEVRLDAFIPKAREDSNG